MLCKNCGQPILEGDLYCAGCGQNIDSAALHETEKSATEEDIECPETSSESGEKNGYTDSKHEQSSLKRVGYCIQCGTPIFEGDLFCAQCGQSVIEPETKATSYPSSNAAGVSAIKQSRNRPVKKYAIIGAVVIGLIALFLVIIQVSDSKRANETENKIQAVKDSMFTFLPEITVGELLDENYSDGHWIYNTRDMCVEFFGTNNNDQSGLSIQFQFVQGGTVNARKSTYDSKGVTVSMESEDFEEYIIWLYNNLPDTYSDIPETIQTTASVKTEKATKKQTTTTTTLPPKPSTDYSLYLKALSEGSVYALFDINQDGITELLLYIGDGSVSSVFEVYSIIDGKLENVGEIDAYSSYLSEKSGKLYLNFGHMNYQVITQINFDGYLVTLEQVSEGEVNGSYKTYGTKLPTYDTTDTSPIKELGGVTTTQTNNKPRVDACIEAYKVSSQSGLEYRLYVEGDFSFIQIYYGYNYDGYSWDQSPHMYQKSEIGDYIKLSCSYESSPPHLIKIIPYSDDDIEGEPILCDIPSSATQSINASAEFVEDAGNMLGEINCHGGVVAGFTTDYVVNGGAVGKVRASLGDGWHIVAKRYCTNYDIMWYELWDSQDGDYYGWVDANYIDFY